MQKIAKGSEKVEMGVYSETDRLKMAAIWGKPSVESAMAQLYPANISLFLGSMNVPKAGEQIEALTALVRSHGVKVTVVKDELTRLLPEERSTKDKVFRELRRKMADAQWDFGTWKIGRRIEDMVVELMERDIREYGEGKALAMIKALCLDPAVPMGNILYARDQANVVLEKRIVSNMAYDIRKPEVDIYERVYGGVLGLTETINVPKGERFEAADLYVHDNTVYIRVGPRTTFGAALHIFSELNKSYKGMTFALLEDSTLHLRSFKEKQELMHLDMFSMPVGRHEIAVCEEEATRSNVSIVKIDKNGKITVAFTGQTFIEYLNHNRYHTLTISKEEQTNFGCNILMIDHNIAIVPKNHNPNPSVVAQLQAGGKTVSALDFGEVTNGFGGTHCSLMQIRRG